MIDDENFPPLKAITIEYDSNPNFRLPSFARYTAVCIFQGSREPGAPGRAARRPLSQARSPSAGVARFFHARHRCNSRESARACLKAETGDTSANSRTRRCEL